MKIILFFLTFFFEFRIINCQYLPALISNTFPTNVSSMQEMVDVSSVTTGVIINIQYQNTNIDMSYTFVLASFTSFYNPNHITLSDFYNAKPSDFSGIMDLTSMQLGKTQYINKVKRSGTKLMINIGNSTLFLTIINLDPLSRRVQIDYQINVQTIGGFLCYSCPFPSAPISNLYCGCSNCQQDYYGPTCSIQMHSIENSQKYSVTLIDQGFAFFRIDDASDDIQINIKISSGTAEAYLQFINFQGQFASYINVAIENSIEKRFNIFGATQGIKIQLTTTGKPISITVAKYDLGNVKVLISYSSVQKLNILAIILGVLGGILLICIIVGACYLIRRYQNSGVAPEVLIGVALNALNDHSTLSQIQIQRFFPTVILKDIIQNQDDTMQNLEQKSKRQLKGQNDCAICLSPVQIQQPVKVTYCHHIFHEKCLKSWFQKQRNCPYCRQQFTKPITIKLYKKLKNESGKTVLKKEKLVKQIMKNKSAISKPMIEEKQFQSFAHINSLNFETLE